MNKVSVSFNILKDKKFGWFIALIIAIGLQAGLTINVAEASVEIIRWKSNETNDPAREGLNDSGNDHCIGECLTQDADLSSSFDEVIRSNNSTHSNLQNFAITVRRALALSCATPVKIMPLGDSITVGKSSGVDDATQWISYRKELWESLQANGYNVDFVGSQVNGEFYTGFDPDHEGYGGKTDAWVADKVYDFLTNNHPVDVVLLHIGTNERKDADPVDVENILDEIDRYETDNNQAVTVILARIINRVNYHQTTTDYNTNVAAMAQARIDNEGDQIDIVDMEDGAGINYAAQPTGDMWDNLHPYATGYTKMAAVWYDALDDLLPVCSFAPTITSSAVTTGTVGQTYSYNVIASGNPVPTYTLIISPTGMTIDSASGLIEWTPTATGTVSVEVEASNSEGTDNQNYTIEVTDGSPQITSTPLTTTRVGQLYNYDVEATDSPAPTYTLSLSPGGMEVDPVTGVISWTPTVTGTFDVTVEAVNSAGSDSQSFSLEVAEPPVCPDGMISYWKLDETSGTIFADYFDGRDASFSGSGTPNYATGQVAGALDFDGIDHTLSTGSASNPTSEITVMAWINPDDLSSRDRGIIAKKDAFVFEIESNGSEMAFTVINGSFDEFEPDVVANEIQTGVWSHVAATFKAGEMAIYINGSQVATKTSTLSALDSSTEPYYIGWTSHTDFGTNRYFDGKLDEVAVFNQALTPTEIQQLYNNGLTGQGYCNPVTFAPQIISDPPTTAIVGQPYSYEVEASGNPVPTYTLSISPAGMMIDTTSGLVEWTPTTTGTITVQVEASNSEGTDSQNFTIEVGTVPAITSIPVTNGVVGQAYSYDVEATGSPAPTYTLMAGPTGMTIDTATGMISWTPTATGTINVEVEAVNSAGTNSQSFSIEVSDPASNSVDNKVYLPLILLNQ